MPLATSGESRTGTRKRADPLRDPRPDDQPPAASYILAASEGGDCIRFHCAQADLFGNPPARSEQALDRSPTARVHRYDATRDLVDFLASGGARQLEEGRGNRVPTRNQRLAALHTFFEYVCTRAP